MSFDADHIVDRRRMRRKLVFWRVVAVLVAIAAVGAVAIALGGRSIGAPGTTQIARVNIRGIIRGDQDRVEALEALAKARTARAVIIHVDSPGGTTAGSEQLHQALRLVAAQKPTIVVDKDGRNVLWDAQCRCMRGNEHVWGAPQHVVRRKRFAFEHIEHCAGQSTGLQSGRQCDFIDDASTPGIDEYRV